MSPDGNKEEFTRVLVAHEHALFRAAIRAALEGEADLNVVGEADDAPAAVGEAQRLDCDIILISAGLPAGGIGACAAVKASKPSAKVILWSEASDLRLLLAALEAGADGYVNQDLTLPEIVEATRRVLRGELSIPSSMVGSLLHELLRHRRDEGHLLDRISRLSRRERQVLALLVEGLGHEAIARALVISPQTARTHIQNLYGKLGVHSRLEATAIAVEHNLVERLSEGMQVETGRRGRS